jgi:protein-tyrosine phosphatase
MPITDEINKLFTNEYTKICEVRKMIKEIKNDSDKAEKYNSELSKLQIFEHNLRGKYRSKEINLINMLKGKLAISGRPGINKIKELKNIDIIVSLLKHKEKDVLELGEEIQANGIVWIWFPLAASNLPKTEDMKIKVIKLYAKLKMELENQKTIMIHCAAGVHRTGAFTNGLLRFCGFSKEKSKLLIKEMREVTAREAFAKHWNWSEQLISSFMSNSLNDPINKLI